jgi:radical SAM protein with 4Fe4S-binding SPASM domain
MAMRIGFVYEITPHCNQDCTFCYNVWKAPGAAHPRELSLPEIQSVLDNALSLPGTDWLTFAGGEPLLSENLLPAIRHVRDTRKGVQIGVATNGQLADRQTIATLVEAGVSYLEIPLHSVDRDLFHALTHSSPVQPRAAISTAAALGIAITVSIIMTEQTVPVLRKTLEYAMLLGAGRIALNRYLPPRTASPATEDMRLSSQRLKQALSIANQAANEWGLPIAISIPVEPCQIDHREFPHLQFSKCACGLAKWCISPNGDLRTCEQNPAALGSLLQSPIAALISAPETDAFRTWKRYDACSACSAFEACASGCRFRYALA